ncbi:MAG: hypothetical protein IPN42_14045 [Methylococcaceae bacterium]|nr:hypothetical protein [Methylococcaceae bacterium]
MKNILVVLSLVMAAFSFQASAAALSWGKIPPISSTISAGGTGNTLFGSQIGLANNVNLSVTWEFLLSAANEVVVNLSSLKVVPTWLTSVMLDGKEINQVGCSAGNGDLVACTNGAWLFKGDLSAGAHVIALIGLTNGNNSGYQINVETDDDIDPTPTPLPGALWLFGSVLVGLIKLTRNSKA